MLQCEQENPLSGYLSGDERNSSKHPILAFGERFQDGITAQSVLQIEHVTIEQAILWTPRITKNERDIGL